MLKKAKRHSKVEVLYKIQTLVDKECEPAIDWLEQNMSKSSQKKGFFSGSNQ